MHSGVSKLEKYFQKSYWFGGGGLFSEPNICQRKFSAIGIADAGKKILILGGCIRQYQIATVKGKFKGLQSLPLTSSCHLLWYQVNRREGGMKHLCRKLAIGP